MLKNREKTNSPALEGIQPDIQKGIQPSQSLDTNNPPGSGSGVLSSIEPNINNNPESSDNSTNSRPSTDSP